jgi:four helix bundle suffix protein
MGPTICRLGALWVFGYQQWASRVRAHDSAALVANAALSLLNLCCYLLDRQLSTQAAAFEKEGGFTERLYRVRSAAKKNRPRPP